MPLVTSKKMLLDAQKGGYAVGAFNVENMEMVKAVIAAAEAVSYTHLDIFLDIQLNHINLCRQRHVKICRRQKYLSIQCSVVHVDYVSYILVCRVCRQEA